MKLSVLAALSENRVIGHAGELPWRLPDELAYVKRITMGHTLVMGRRTYESIGRPLPGRTSIVISGNPKYAPHPDVVVVQSLDAALASARECGESEVFVFGGEAVYALALPRAERLYLTRVHAEVEGDAFFPEIDEAAWTLREQEHHPADERHAFAFTFQVLDRRPSTGC
jgi:dihydrofolate reductase